MNLAYEARRSAWPQPEPTTLNEKIWHRRATDRRPILKTYCDKVASLELVEDRLPAEVLPERLEVADSFAGLERGHLPRECVIKVSHASGGSFVVWDGPASAGQGFDAWVRRAFRSGDVPWTQVDHEISQALHHDYGWEMLEWGYLDLPRMVVVDRLYRAADGGLPPDLMMFVFHGQVEVVRINADRQREQRGPGTTYDRNWSPLPIDTRAPRGDYPRPVELDLAIELAEALCPDEEMARVDFLLTADGLRFGEITAYHLGGNAEFRLEWADRYLGSLW
jgi:hypothetical protein